MAVGSPATGGAHVDREGGEAHKQDDHQGGDDIQQRDDSPSGGEEVHDEAAKTYPAKKTSTPACC